ncbi:4'-phosphopantetheinyl transferase family protein [Granulicella cerasi]|uniref:4'-phosphopantetheinyl transferase family protein n=1 Tax=Granulicella cerasi TaxID=741063 RepID=A0ABW1ZA12_9BACT|nr:4'-phosphopantetheinyl transferase superfamily protein [Granulicella cerasi]
MAAEAADQIIVGLMRTAQATPAEYAAALVLLSSEERDRAARFLREEPRQEFVFARALFRRMASQRLGIAPQAVTLRFGERGKPMTEELEFNLSHTRGLVACALGGRIAVGIDIEADSSQIEALELAETAFSPSDVAELRNLADPVAQRYWFLQRWTEREAVAKCLGQGIADPRALHGDWSQGVTLESLSVGDGYFGSLAYSAQACCSVVEQWWLLGAL